MISLNTLKPNKFQDCVATRTLCKGCKGVYNTFKFKKKTFVVNVLKIIISRCGEQDDIITTDPLRLVMTSF